MRRTTSGSAGAEGDTSPLMPHTTGKRYAVVSCHVERPLDDEVWRRFLDLQAARPGGFRIAALFRPADAAAGEDETAWLERARAASTLGPFGQHTHWTAPDHARPTSGGTGERVLAEGARLRELGLAPTLFCGGGWYTDVEVAEACAELAYVDCTPRGSRPSYLGPSEAWASLAAPARVRLPSGRTIGAIPTTHSLGELARTRGRDLSRCRASLLPRHGPARPSPTRAPASAPHLPRAFGRADRSGCAGTRTVAPRARDPMVRNRQ